MERHDDDRPRPRFGAAYWAAMGFSLILVLAGAVVGFFGPRLFPAHPPQTPARAAGLATRPGASK